MLAVLGDPHGIPAEESGGLALLSAGYRSHTNLEAALLLRLNDCGHRGVGIGHHTDLSVGEGGCPSRACLLLGACSQAIGGLSKLMVCIQGGFHRGVVQRSLAAVVIHHFMTISP